MGTIAKMARYFRWREASRLILLLKIEYQTCYPLKLQLSENAFQHYFNQNNANIGGDATINGTNIGDIGLINANNANIGINISIIAGININFNEYQFN